MFFVTLVAILSWRRHLWSVDVVASVCQCSKQSSCESSDIRNINKIPRMTSIDHVTGDTWSKTVQGNNARQIEDRLDSMHQEAFATLSKGLHDQICQVRGVSRLTLVYKNRHMGFL